MKLTYYIIGAGAVPLLGVLSREFFRHVTLQNRCPVCKDDYPDRIKRPSWAKSLDFLMPSQRFYCYACGNRFIRFGKEVQQDSTVSH